ncbi:MAG: transcription termination factor NusA [Firmicutes bacterium]|nr:transcription termination factor NusA [Bacillota bacterium]MCL5993205.1 transcription termination factor NusA [Bacillota bacterium]
MNEDFLAAMAAIEKEKGVKKEILFDAIEAALVSAYKRNFNTAANVRVQLNRDSGEIKVFTRLVVVAEVFQAQLEISLAEVREIDLNYQLGDIVEKEVTPKNFGRIAAQTAKQVVIQRIREAEREMVFDEYIDREEDIITGIVQRIEQKNVIVDLGKAEAVLSPTEQMPSDEYKQGERVKAYINEVRKTTKGPQIFISRTHPGLLKRLFELEVPEIFDGTVEIKAVAREAGFRSKLAVYSKNRDVDPVGACVGPKGARVQAIVDELRGEKIDIVKWDENPEIFVANALSPAKVVVVMLQSAQKVANVIVPDYQLSLAIGKEGQNARLAAKLTNWKIDIASESQAAERASSSLEASERLSRRERELEEPEISVGSSQRKALVGTTLAKGVADDETP